jgi:hypothetical protein
MKLIKMENLRFLASKEYTVGYEFSEWKNGKWVSAAQFKLDYFIRRNN